MMPDRLAVERLHWRRVPADSRSEQIGTTGEKKLSWRLSLLVILSLSLALWAAVWEIAAALLRSQS